MPISFQKNISCSLAFIYIKKKQKKKTKKKQTHDMGGQCGPTECMNVKIAQIMEETCTHRF